MTPNAKATIATIVTLAGLAVYWQFLMWVGDTFGGLAMFLFTPCAMGTWLIWDAFRMGFSHD